MKKRRFVVTDVDGTFFRSSLVIELLEFMIASGLIKKEARGMYLKEYLAWHDRHGSYEAYIEAVIRAFRKYLRGLSEKTFERASRKVIAKFHSKVYAFTRALVKEAKAEDYFLIIISYSPKETLALFGKHYGFDEVYGLRYDKDKNGCLTGRVRKFGKDKSQVLKKVIKKHNLTTAGSIGLGDTESDESFLTLVENPICFNPNRKLLAMAKKRKWLVVVERKDVIYCSRNRAGRSLLLESIFRKKKAALL